MSAPGTAQRKTGKQSRKAPVEEPLIIEIQALDSEQHFVPLADNMVHCQIQGPAHLLGMDNGNLSDLTLYGLPMRKLFSGKLLAVLRADEPGTVTVTFTAEGLKPAQTIAEIL